MKKVAAPRKGIRNNMKKTKTPVSNENEQERGGDEQQIPTAVVGEKRKAVEDSKKETDTNKMRKLGEAVRNRTQKDVLNQMNDPHYFRNQDPRNSVIFATPAKMGGMWQQTDVPLDDEGNPMMSKNNKPIPCTVISCPAVVRFSNSGNGNYPGPYCRNKKDAVYTIILEFFKLGTELFHEKIKSKEDFLKDQEDFLAHQSIKQESTHDKQWALARDGQHNGLCAARIEAARKLAVSKIGKEKFGWSDEDVRRIERKAGDAERYFKSHAAYDDFLEQFKKENRYMVTGNMKGLPIPEDFHIHLERERKEIEEGKTPVTRLRDEPVLFKLTSKIYVPIDRDDNGKTVDDSANTNGDNNNVQNPDDANDFTPPPGMKRRHLPIYKLSSNAKTGRYVRLIPKNETDNLLPSGSMVIVRMLGVPTQNTNSKRVLDVVRIYPGDGYADNTPYEDYFEDGDELNNFLEEVEKKEQELQQGEEAKRDADILDGNLKLDTLDSFPDLEKNDESHGMDTDGPTNPSVIEQEYDSTQIDEEGAYI